MNDSINTASEQNPKISKIIARLNALFPDQIEFDKWDDFLSKRTESELDALYKALFNSEQEINDAKQYLPDDLIKIIYDYFPLEKRGPHTFETIQSKTHGDLILEINRLLESPLGKILGLSDELVGKIIKSTGKDYNSHGIDVDIMSNTEIGKRIKQVLCNFAQKNMDKAQNICDTFLQEGKRKSII